MLQTKKEPGVPEDKSSKRSWASEAAILSGGSMAVPPSPVHPQRQPNDFGVPDVEHVWLRHRGRHLQVLIRPPADATGFRVVGTTGAPARSPDDPAVFALTFTRREWHDQGLYVPLPHVNAAYDLHVKVFATREAKGKALFSPGQSTGSVASIRVPYFTDVSLHFEVDSRGNVEVVLEASTDIDREVTLEVRFRPGGLPPRTSRQGRHALTIRRRMKQGIRYRYRIKGADPADLATFAVVAGDDASADLVNLLSPAAYLAREAHE